MQTRKKSQEKSYKEADLPKKTGKRDGTRLKHTHTLMSAVKQKQSHVFV